MDLRLTAEKGETAVLPGKEEVLRMVRSQSPKRKRQREWEF